MPPPNGVGAGSGRPPPPNGGTRRSFLQRSLAWGGAALLGAGGAAVLGDALGLLRNPSSERPADPFAGGRWLGTLLLDSDGPAGPPCHVLLGEGLDARLFTDLSTIGPERLITPNDQFFVRTSCPDSLPPAAPWTIRARGLVQRPLDLALEDLRPLAAPAGVHLMECAGNSDPRNFGLLSAAAWAGVPLVRLLERLEILPQATRVLVSGFDRHALAPRGSTPGASWIFSLDELVKTGAFLATEMNGVALPRDHGFPVRLVVPGWYGCTCIKWVDEIQLLDDSATATRHMLEFARRTHQPDKPRLARDFTPARIDQAAMPLRVEQWRVAGALLHRVVGILWGGSKPTVALAIRFNPDEPYQPVSVCPPPATTSTWTLWSHPWRPTTPGRYQIVLRIDDPSVPTRRLDGLFYAREVRVDDV